MAHKPLPTHADLINYNYAVAGHDGTLSDVDGELFIKPCTPAEIAFYESSLAAHPDFAEFMPTFLGTLSLDRSTSDVNILAAGEALLAQHNHAVHLDPSHHEHHAHLTVSQDGAILEDPEAHSCSHHSHTPATNGNGTSATEGDNYPAGNAVLPIAKHTVPEVVVPNKVVGKRIATNTAIVLENAAHGFTKPNILDVKLGVRLYADDASAEKKARFDKVSAETTHKDLGFRIAGMRVWQGGEAARAGKGVDVEGYKIFDKNYGRLEVNTNNIVEAFRNFIFCEGAGVDEELGKLVAQAMRVDVERIMKVMEAQESRMFSASLLFVFEGDGKALREAMEEASSRLKEREKNGIAFQVNGNGNGVDSADQDHEAVEEGDDEEEEEEEDTTPKIYIVKVIDFAHAQWVEGEGPDENSLKGVRSVAKILKEIGGD